MKKLAKIALIIMLLFPFTINACPHFDEEGNLYFMYYDMEDYNVTVILYPRGDYNQEYKYFIESPEGDYLDEKPSESILFEENFEVPLYRVRDIYDFDSPFSGDSEPIVQNDDEVLITGDFFDIKVRLSDAKDKILPKNLESISTASYLINHKIIDEKALNNEFEVLKNIFKDTDLNFEKAHHFSTGQMIIDQNWLEEEISFDSIEESKKVSMDNPYEFPVVLHVNSLNKKDIDVSVVPFEIIDNKIVYEVEENGYYILGDSAEEIDNFSVRNESGRVETEEDDSIFKTSLVISSGIILFGTMIYFTNKKG